MLGEALHEPLARQLLISANVGHCQDEEWLRGMLQLSLRTTWVEAMSRYLESWSGDDFAEAVKGEGAHAGTGGRTRPGLHRGLDEQHAYALVADGPAGDSASSRSLSDA